MTKGKYFVNFLFSFLYFYLLFSFLFFFFSWGSFVSLSLSSLSFPFPPTLRSLSEFTPLIGSRKKEEDGRKKKDRRKRGGKRGKKCNPILALALGWAPGTPAIRQAGRQATKLPPPPRGVTAEERRMDQNKRGREQMGWEGREGDREGRGYQNLQPGRYPQYYRYVS